MILPALICFAYNILNGEYDARQFAKQKKISHFKNGFIYCVVVGLITIAWVVWFSGHWTMFISLLFLRPLVFDQYLNVRRGKGFTYQPEKPDSWVDRMENKIFGHKRAWALSNLIYLIIFIGGWVLYENVK